jgi:hypothetical protein
MGERPKPRPDEVEEPGDRHNTVETQMGPFLSRTEGVTAPDEPLPLQVPLATLEASKATAANTQEIRDQGRHRAGVEEEESRNLAAVREKLEHVEIKPEGGENN